MGMRSARAWRRGKESKEVRVTVHLRSKEALDSEGERGQKDHDHEPAVGSLVVRAADWWQRKLLNNTPCRGYLTTDLAKTHQVFFHSVQVENQKHHW